MVLDDTIIDKDVHNLVEVFCGVYYHKNVAQGNADIDGLFLFHKIKDTLEVALRFITTATLGTTP